jgi:hypothetical protein
VSGLSTRKPRAVRGERHKGSHGGARVLREHHEYVCTHCGHRGWSRHKDILRKPLATTP